MPEGGVIAGISSMAMRQALAELVDAWNLRGGPPASLLSIGGVDVARRVRAGEAFDFVVLASDVIAALVTEGRLDPPAHALADSAMAIAIAEGAPRFAVDTEVAVRDAVLAARLIGSSTGPSGAALDQLLARWGVAERIAPKLVIAKPGTPVGGLIASGAADLGFQQLGELIHVPGVQVLGTLPPPIEVITRFSAGIGAGSPRKNQARALLQWLASGSAHGTLRRHGMAPPRS